MPLPLWGPKYQACIPLVGQQCSLWWYFSLPPLQGQHLAFPAVALWLTVGLAICVVGLLAVLAYVCQKKIRQSCEEEEENAGNVVANPLQKGWGFAGGGGWMEGVDWGSQGKFYLARVCLGGGIF